MTEDLVFSDAPRRKGVLAALRKKWPDRTWIAQRAGMGWEYWTADGKWHGCWVACLAPRYDGDDDTFVSRFYIYRQGQSTILFLP